jgi:hypothetical protein
VIELRGAARTYHLDCASFNALCRLEELTGRRYEAVMRELRGTRATTATVRAFVAAALVDPPDTLDEVDPILKDIGGVRVIRQAVRIASGPVKPRKGR